MERKLPQDDILYLAGTEEITEKAQAKFIKYFQDLPGRVLEVGCGKGVMLSMLKEHGIDAYGIDLSDTAVEYCKSKKLYAIHDDLISHIKSLNSESIGGIFCAHLIEHLTPIDVIEFFKNAKRVLMPGGKLIIITPNAKDLRTTERFWIDITHVRPYPKKLIIGLLQKEGFNKIRTMNDTEPVKNIFERILKTLIRMWFLGYMFVGDLIVITEKE